MSGHAKTEPWRLSSLLGAGIVLAVGAVSLRLWEAREEEPEVVAEPSSDRFVKDDSKSARVWQVRSPDARKLLNQADDYLLEDDPESAHQLLTKGLKRYPMDAAPFHYQRAGIELLSENYDGALADSSMVTTLKPELVHGYNLRAYVLLHMGRLEDSAASYAKVMELDRNFPGLRIPTLWSLDTSPAGGWGILSSLFDKKTEILAKPLDGGEDFKEVRGLRAGIKLERIGGTTVQVLPNARQMYSAVLNTSGMEYSRSGKPAQAVVQFNKLLALDPDFRDDEVVLTELCRCQLELKRGKEALELATRLKILEPSKSDVHVLCGESCVLLSKFDDALKHFQEAIELNPYNSVASNRLIALSGVQPDAA